MEENPIRSSHTLADAIARYTQWTEKTAVTNNPSRDTTRFVLGVVGEVGEVIEDQNSDSITSELGDIGWYLFRLAYMKGVDVRSWAQNDVAESDEIQPLVVAAAELCEAEKKRDRDGTEPDWDRLIKNCLTQWRRYTESNYNLLSILEENVSKLEKRLEDNEIMQE